MPVSPLAFQFEHYSRLKEWKIFQTAEGRVILVALWEGELSRADHSRLTQEVRKVVTGRPVEVVTHMESCFKTVKFKRVVSQYVPK
jgi:hypothetical protein